MARKADQIPSSRCTALASHLPFRKLLVPLAMSMGSLVLLVGCRQQGSPAERIASSFLSHKVAEPVRVDSLERAMRIQADVVKRLQTEWGQPVGYKAALTTPEAQARFGVHEPLWGTFLRTMFVPTGSTVPADFGARPTVEGDFIVRVAREEINEAETDEQLLAGVDAVIPFIELPDLLFPPDVAIDGPMLAAINVGARLGVLGQPIPLPEAPGDAHALLGDIRVELIDDAAGILSQGSTQQLLGHPVHVIRWLRDQLRAVGRRLRPGDLLSLGSMTDLHPVRAGTTVRARYLGLGPHGTTEISVSFR